MTTVNRLTHSNQNKIKYKSFITETNEKYNKYDKNDLKHNGMVQEHYMNKAQSCRMFSKIRNEDQDTFTFDKMSINTK